MSLLKSFLKRNELPNNFFLASDPILLMFLQYCKNPCIEVSKMAMERKMQQQALRNLYFQSLVVYTNLSQEKGVAQYFYSCQ